MIVLTAGSGRLCALMEAEAAQSDSCAPDSASGAIHRIAVWEGGAAGQAAGADGTSSRARTEDPLIKSQML